jgi:hypothetical protein
MMLQERTEEADEDEEDGNSEKQNEGKELAQCLSRPLGGVIRFIMVRIQSGHIYLYCHRGVAANNESHCLRRRCPRSTSM